MGWAISMPFLAIYMSQTLGINPAIVGATYTVAAVFGALSQILAGSLADRIGRRRTMILSMSVRVVVFVLMTLAVHFSFGFISLAILMTASSITGNTYYPAANAMITDVVAPGKRVEGFGLARVGINIGWALGPALGGVSSEFISYSFTFMLTAVLSAITLAMTIAYIKESAPTTDAERFDIKELLKIRKERSFMVYCFVTILASIIAMQMVSTLSMYSQRYTSITEAELGLLFTVNGVLVVFLQFPLSRALSSHRLTTLLAAGTLLYVIGYFSYAFFLTFPLMLLAMAVITLGEIISSPPALTMVSNMSPSAKRGQYMGVYGFFESLGGSFGPSIGSLAIALFPTQPIIIWAIPSVFGIAAVIGYIALGRRLDKKINVGGF